MVSKQQMRNARNVFMSPAFLSSLQRMVRHRCHFKPYLCQAALWLSVPGC
jgi:hypothetical protein